MKLAIPAMFVFISNITIAVDYDLYYQLENDLMTDAQTMTVTAAEDNKSVGFRAMSPQPIRSIKFSCTKTKQYVELEYRTDKVDFNFKKVTIRIGDEKPMQLYVDKIYRPDNMYMLNHARVNFITGVPGMLAQIANGENVVVKLGSLSNGSEPVALSITSKKSIIKAYKKCKDFNQK